MKIVKLLSMRPVLAVCLALAAVSVSQVMLARSHKRVLGAVNLMKDGKNKQKVKVFLEANGVLRLDDKKVEELRLEDDSVYSPGKSSGQREIKIGEDGRMWADSVPVVSLQFGSDGSGWDRKACYCLDPPPPPWPAPPPPLVPDPAPALALSMRREIGTVRLRKNGKNKQKVKAFLETNGVLRLGDKIVKELRLEDNRAYFPGRSSDQREVKIGKKGEIRIDGVLATGVYLVSDSVGWNGGAKCYSLGSPKDPAPLRK